MIEEKTIMGIIAGLEEHFVTGEIIDNTGKQITRVMRLYELRFYAYPDLVDGIMNPEYKGNALGAPVTIKISPFTTNSEEENK